MGLIVTTVVALGVGIGGGEWEQRITAHYGETAMPRVLSVRDWRYEHGQGPWIPRSQCYIAHPTIPLGAWVQVKGLNTGKVVRCVVADTSEPEDRARHIRTHLIEIDWANTVTICGSRSLRNDECPSLVRRLGHAHSP